MLILPRNILWQSLGFGSLVLKELVPSDKVEIVEIRQFDSLLSLYSILFSFIFER
jgi:hypothetical protein